MSACRSDQRIYEENKGWTCAKFLLAHERTGIAGVAGSKRGIERIKAIATTELDGDKPLLANPFFRRKVAELEMDLTALEYTELRSLAGDAAGQGAGRRKARCSRSRARKSSSG